MERQSTRTHPTRTTSFAAGMLMAFSLGSLFQDYFGRVGFAEFVLEHWTPAWFSVPLALVELVLAAVTYSRATALDRGDAGDAPPDLPQAPL